MLGLVWLGYVRLGLLVLDYIRLGFVWLVYVRLEYGRLRLANVLVYVTLKLV